METAHGTRHIALVSDLLENTPAYSTYRSAPDAGRLMRVPAFAELADGRLQGVVVEILRLPNDRSARRQGPDLDAMWVTEIAAAGGEARPSDLDP